MPEARRVRSPLLRLGLLMMCALWTVSGWYFIAVRSFSTRPIRSPVVTTVDGWGAVFAGAVFVLLGLIALAIVLQGAGTRKPTQWLLVGLLFLVPAVLVLGR